MNRCNCNCQEQRMPPRTPQALPIGQANIYPLGEPHAVSVSLPTWDSVIGLSRKEKWLLDQLEWSYPRFHINKPVQELADAVLTRLQITADNGISSDNGTTTRCMVFASPRAALECVEALKRSDEEHSRSPLETIRFFMPAESNERGLAGPHWANFSAVLLGSNLWKEAMAFWRDTGSGLSTRHAEYILTEFDYLDSDCLTTPAFRTPAPNKRECQPGSCRAIPYSLRRIHAAASSVSELRSFLARLASSDRPGEPAVRADDVFLYPNGMNAIYSLSESLAGTDSTVAAFGWLYPETVDVLRGGSWGRCLSYKLGNEEELQCLEEALRLGQPVHALFCELPSNILLSSPDLRRLRGLADRYGFIVVCDDTVAGFVNLDALPLVDVMVSSLTKTFSGASNVTGGSVILNPSSQHHQTLKTALATYHSKSPIEYFPLDARTLLENSKDIVWRVRQCNANTLPLVDLLRAHPSIATVHHPSTAPTSHLYKAMMRKGGGYGNVLSIVFHDPRSAEHFYNVLRVCKGSSFGANFTLAIPYVQLANYWNREKVPKYGVPEHIIRLSVGLEDVGELVDTVGRALTEVEVLEGIRSR
ncbi:pyridoxal phosphate-dependent transferase [Aspergillus recurvatus]